MQRSVFVVLSLASFSLMGCVNHNFIPGPGANPNAQQVSGQCKLVALSGQQVDSFEASGSPKFVAAATGAHIIGSAIGNAVRTNTVYNACMEAQGYVDAPKAPGT